MSKAGEVWDRIRTVPGLGGNVAAVAVVVVLGVFSAGYVISNYDISLPGQQPYTFAAQFDKAPGLNVASTQEVRIAGVPVGEVVEAIPEEGGTARLVMTLEPGHTVYDNAFVSYRTKTPLNVPYISLQPGGPPGMPLGRDAVIPVSQTDRFIQPFEVLNALDDNTQMALTSLIDQSDVALAEAPQLLPGGLRATDATLARFRPVVESLQTRRALIEQLVTSLSQISTAAGKDDVRLTRLIDSLQATLSVLSTRDGDLGATIDALPGLSDSLREAMSGTSKLTAELNPVLDGLDEASEELPAALSETEDAVAELDDLIDDAGNILPRIKHLLRDLRPVVDDAHAAFDDLAVVSDDLPAASEKIAPWMPNLAAFVYQTSSAFSLHDANGGFGRAVFFFDASNPSGGLQDESLHDEAEKQRGN